MQGKGRRRAVGGILGAVELLSVWRTIVGGIARVATVVVLFTGVVAMARGGGFDARWGNKLMRLRIIAQGAAVALPAALPAVTYR